VYKLLKSAATESLSENCIYWENYENEIDNKSKTDNEEEEDDDKERKILHSKLENKLRNDITDYYFNEISNTDNVENKWGFCDEELIDNAKRWYNIII